ncbi:hypothetical protein [Rhodosalinus sediminis]|uniref:hypothetical protein n=1 Tax=Rhodosalinus sediminis TaxID=1940533 RepID=UPI00235486DB|nr:hypothetical protein [Rhodosalinus sediminis]
MAGRRQRWVRWLLRPLGWLTARLASLAVTAALVGSLFVVSLAFETTTKALSWAAQAVMGRSYVASAVAENKTLKKRNRQLLQDVGELRGRNADLTRRNGELADEAEDLRARNQRLSGENGRLKTQAEETVDMIDRRSAALGRRMLRTSTRNVASIPLESAPITGPVVVIIITALEISDSCAMINEMQGLREFAGLERQDSFVAGICSLVPTFPVDTRYPNAKRCREHQDELRAEYGETSPEVASVVGAICTCLEDVGIPDKASCYPEEIATVPSP